jgi:hypothetical protein
MSYIVAPGTGAHDRVVVMPDRDSIMVSGAVGAATPSSTLASQSSSIELQTSGEAPCASGSESRQSPDVVM